MIGARSTRSRANQRGKSCFQRQPEQQQQCQPVSEIFSFRKNNRIVPQSGAEDGDAPTNSLLNWSRPKADTSIARRHSSVIMKATSRMSLTENMALAVVTTSLDASGVGRFVINPRKPMMRVWDFVTSVALLYTATVTAYEVAFITADLPALFWINRVVDIVFMLDLIMQFFLSYYDEWSDVWVTDHKRIALNYLRTWFVIDLVSILPYEFLGSDTPDGLNKLKIIRIVKLLRLAKLLRVLRAGRVFQRMESNLNISYTTMKLCLFAIGVALCAHWMACALYIVAAVEDCQVNHFYEEECINWVYYYNDNGGNQALLVTDEAGVIVANIDSSAESPDSLLGPAQIHQFSVYWAAVYWAIMTMSTIGYGDVTPQTDAERVYVTVGMILGACIYAYMVGNVCSIIAEMSEAQDYFRQLLDKLNQFMTACNLPRELRADLRSLYRFRNSNVNMQGHQAVLRTLTPMLQAQVAGYTDAAWLQHSDMFASFPAEMVVELYLSMKSEVYVPNEFVFDVGTVSDRLFITERGLIWYKGQLYSRRWEKPRESSFWIGTLDVYTSSGVHRHQAVSLTYSVMFSLRKESLDAQLNRYPAVKKLVRRATARATFKEVILMFARCVKSFLRSEKDMLEMLYDPGTVRHFDNWMLRFKFPQLIELVMLRLGYDHSFSQMVMKMKKAAVLIQTSYRGHRARRHLRSMMQYVEFLERHNPGTGTSLSAGMQMVERRGFNRRMQAAGRRFLGRIPTAERPKPKNKTAQKLLKAASSGSTSMQIDVALSTRPEQESLPPGAALPLPGSGGPSTTPSFAERPPLDAVLSWRNSASSADVRPLASSALPSPSGPAGQQRASQICLSQKTVKRLRMDIKKVENTVMEEVNDIKRMVRELVAENAAREAESGRGWS